MSAFLRAYSTFSLSLSRFFLKTSFHNTMKIMSVFQRNHCIPCTRFIFPFGFHNTLKGNECIPLRFFLIEGLCFHRDSKGMHAFLWFYSHFFSEGLCFHILSSFLFFQSFLFSQRKGMSAFLFSLFFILFLKDL